jgi:hypothetical protein
MLEHGKKVTFFNCHRRFLPLNHPFWSDRWPFLKGKTVRKGPPKWKLRADITKMLDELKESENVEFEGYGEKHKWTKKICLWELAYAKSLILPNNINLMHQEWNVVESIMGKCLDITDFMKDNMNARKDLAPLCDHPSLEAKTNAKGNLSRPRAPYCLKPRERKEILKWLKTLKFSDRYATNTKWAVNVEKVVGAPLWCERTRPQNPEDGMILVILFHNFCVSNLFIMLNFVHMPFLAPNKYLKLFAKKFCFIIYLSLFCYLYVCLF